MAQRERKFFPGIGPELPLDATPEQMVVWRKQRVEELKAMETEAKLTGRLAEFQAAVKKAGEHDSLCRVIYILMEANIDWGKYY